MSEGAGRVRAFLSELRRRKVYRAAAFYIVAASGTIQLADIVVPYTRLPSRTPAVLFGIAVVGFPVILVLAWVFDVTGGVCAAPSRPRPPARRTTTVAAPPAPPAPVPSRTPARSPCSRSRTWPARPRPRR